MPKASSKSTTIFCSMKNDKTFVSAHIIVFIKNCSIQHYNNWYVSSASWTAENLYLKTVLVCKDQYISKHYTSHRLDSPCNSIGYLDIHQCYLDQTAEYSKSSSYFLFLHLSKCKRKKADVKIKTFSVSI